MKLKGACQGCGGRAADTSRHRGEGGALPFKGTPDPAGNPWNEAVSHGSIMRCFMAHPSSAEADTYERGLDEYRRLGGNCIHLPGEGGETHSRRPTGQRLESRGLWAKVFLCTQIYHEVSDETTKRAIVRF